MFDVLWWNRTKRASSCGCIACKKKRLAAAKPSSPAPVLHTERDLLSGLSLSKRWGMPVIAGRDERDKVCATAPYAGDTDLWWCQPKRREMSGYNPPTPPPIAGRSLMQGLGTLYHGLELEIY